MRLQSHSWAYIQKKNMILKDTCIPIFTATLFTIANLLFSRINVRKQVNG